MEPALASHAWNLAETIQAAAADAIAAEHAHARLPSAEDHLSCQRAAAGHDGSLDLVCTRDRVLKILKITGLTEVFGIYETVDQAIAAKGRR